MKTHEMSRKKPDRDLDAKTVVVKAGLPKDRLKGYIDDDFWDVPAKTLRTGADATVALVGQYKKRNKKGFGKSSGY